MISRHCEPNDLPTLYAFLGQVRQSVDRNHYLHVGDLSWHVFHMLAAYPPSDLIRLWLDGQGTLLGFALVYPDFGVFDLQIHPDFKLLELESEMLGWAQIQLITLNNNNDAFYTLVNEHDNLRSTLLESQTFARMGDWLHMQRPLTTPIPTPSVPPGFKLSDLTQVDSDKRATALGLAFGAPPRLPQYRQFMTAPNYDPQLDIVAVAPSGEVAAFAMCWQDPGNKDGQFEPIGTVSAFQRQGLGKAVLLEGMRRMAERGMQNVLVIVDASEEPACQLYKSIGLVPRWKLYLYGKQREQ